MTDVVILAIILVAVIVLYITRWLPLEITSLLIVPALVFTGILDAHAALSGFSSSATITIGCMFVLSAGLMRTGGLEFVTLTLGRHSRGSVTRFLLLLAAVVPLASAVMNNTPVVVMMVPVVLALSREFNVKPSKLMIPLSYFAILGGTCTLIGTSTNVLVHELYKSQGGPGFGMFDFTPLGLFYVIGGAAFLLLTSQKLLPERTSLAAMLPRGRTAKFVTEIVIESDSSFCGRSARETFHESHAVRLLEIVRDETAVLAPQALEMNFRADDALIIEGAPKDIAEFLTASGASLPTVVEDNQRVPMRTMELSLAEAVVLPQSPFIGRNVSDLGLNRQYGVKVLAIQRRGRHHRYKIRQMRLKPGDVLLLQAGDNGFHALRETEAVLLSEGLEQAIFHKTRGAVAVGIMAVVMGLAAVTPLPLVALAVAGAVAMIVTRCLRVDEAFRSLDATVLLLMAGAIPLGRAMTETGMAEMLVHGAHDLFAGAGPTVQLSVFYLVTSLVSQVISNNATAVLMTPIALGLAAQMGIDPKPFLMAICFGASASFMTPVGYKTNAIVMGPGGYRFSDYMRIGIPMTIIMWILATILIPLFWPFA